MVVVGIREFRKKEFKTKQKMIRGWCSWRVLPRIWNFEVFFFFRAYDVDRLGLFNGFSQQVSSFVR